MIAVQPLLEVQQADGETLFHRMVDESGEFIMLPVPDDNNWHTCTNERPEIDPEDNIIGLRIRVFISDEMTARLPLDAGFVYLDSVVPTQS